MELPQIESENFVDLPKVVLRSSHFAVRVTLGWRGGRR